MRKVFYLTTLSFVLTVFTGCESEQSSNDVPPGSGDAHVLGHGDEHKGPHDGHVIELGRNHEYHAEIVEDEERQLVTVYILGDNMQELPIAAEKLTMSLMVQGEPRTFELLATGASGGKASRFDADADLFEALHKYEASGKLSVTIDGTPFVGTVAHHDHSQGHDDEHGHDQDDQAHGDGHEN